MRKVLLVFAVMGMVMGCNGKGLTSILPTGPSDVTAAMSSKNNESTGIATLAFSAPSSVRVGEEFTVEVTIANANLFGGGYNLQFDATHLQFLRIEEGSFFNQDGKSTALLKSLSNGGLEVGQTRLGHVFNASGSGIIAKITFKAISAGNIELGFNNVRLREMFIEKEEYLLRDIVFSTQNTTLRIE